MKTKIVNATGYRIQIREGNANIFRLLATVQDNCAFDIYRYPNATYREFTVLGPLNSICITSDDLIEAREIIVYITPTEILEWRVSTWGSPSFYAVKKDASSRMKFIATSHARLLMLLKEVKICPAQCQNLVQTCLDGLKGMEEAYNEKSERDMWQLYSSKKLGQIISSLDKLLSTLGSIQDLLQACGSNWGSVTLAVSLPLPSPERMYSKFDILMKELHWNLETIHYELHLTGGVEFKWNDKMVRYVLETTAAARVMVAEDMEPEQSRRLASEDREHLQCQLQSGSILFPGKSLLYSLLGHLGFKFSTDQWRDNLAAELRERLKEPAVLSNDSSSIPDCFWIKTADLKLHNKLSGDPASKSVWKGQWCGQAVAIRITKNTHKAAVEKEAGLMLKVQHPNIVGFLGCAFTDDAPAPVRSGTDEKCSAGYLVMELMQEDLRNLILRRARSHPGNPFILPVTVDILLQIAGAMVHMHNLGIMHRDLKSANCLVNPRSSSDSSSQVLKLIDFELSKELDPNAPISNHTVRSGTVRWMAPEVWGVHNSDANSWERSLCVPYTRSADVWSFGMTCYEVITGKRPFYEYRSNGDLVKALRDGKRPLIPASCPEGLKALMWRCWAQEPSDKPYFKDIRKDLWTIKYQLEYNNSEVVQAQEPSLEAQPTSFL